MRKYTFGAGFVVVCAVGLVVGGGLAGAGEGMGGRPFRLELSGAEEVPVNEHGDDDHGSVVLTINLGQEEVCWTFGTLTFAGEEALPGAAHIHEAAPGAAGGVVVPLFGTLTTPPAPTSYPTPTTCVSGDAEVLRAILADAGGYYVNLHNEQHPGGVMRAQLK